MSLLYESPKNKNIFLHNDETMIPFSHIMKLKKFNIYLVSPKCSPYSEFPNNVLIFFACVYMVQGLIRVHILTLSSLI